jgi:hypothetical protein
MRRKLFVIFFAPGPRWVKGKSLDDQPHIIEHVQHLRAALSHEELVMAGPFRKEHSYTGMAVLTVGTEEEAR